MAAVTATVRVVDDAVTPAVVDGVLVRVFDNLGAFISSGLTGAVTPGEVDFTLTGDVAGIQYDVILSKDGVSFPPAPTKLILVTDPPNPNNTFQFTAHIGLVDQVVTFVVKDDQGTPQPVEDTKIRVFDQADLFVTELETDAAGEAELVLAGAVSPGLSYIIRLTPPAGYVVQTGTTQTVSVIDPLTPPETNVFDFVLEAPPGIPTTTDPDMCRVSGSFIDSSKRPLKNLTLIFHPREGYPEVFLAGSPYSGEPSTVSGGVVASDRRVNTDKNGRVEFDLPRESVFDVYVQGMDAPDTTLLACVFIPDAAGIDIQEVLYPYITQVTYDSVVVAVNVDETVELGLLVETSNLMDLSELTGSMGAFLEFTVDDELVAAVELTVEGVLSITGLTAGVVTLSVARKIGTVAPRRPPVADVLALPSEPVITVS